MARAVDYFVTYYIRAERSWTYFEYDCIQHIVYAVWISEHESINWWYQFLPKIATKPCHGRPKKNHLLLLKPWNINNELHAIGFQIFSETLCPTLHVTIQLMTHALPMNQENNSYRL